MSNLAALTDVSVHFRIRAGFARRPLVLRAVENVSLDIGKGETLALVGESGSGKTTLGHVVAGLTQPTTGTVSVNGREPRDDRVVQVIFQDPFSALDPRMLVSDIIAEPVRLSEDCSVGERRARAAAMLHQVGLPQDAAGRYPHEFSGGQRQRIAIARSIISNPVLIVADEPLSALDVSIQSQILNLMKDIQEARGLSYLFISHDLTVVNHLADRVAIMYLGRLMEVGSREDIFAAPSHPYTKALLASMPRIGQRRKRRGAALTGEIPSPLSPPSGCVFHTRCPIAKDVCRQEKPSLLPAPGRPGQRAACHFRT